MGYLLARFGLGMIGHQLYAATVLAALPTAQNVFSQATRYLLTVPSMLVIAALLG